VVKYVIGSLIAIFALVGCTASAEPTGTPTFASTDSVIVPTTAPPSPNGVVNERGNVVKKVGEAGAIRDIAQDVVIVNFRVTKIADFKCKDTDYTKNENGKYIALDFNVETKTDPGKMLDGVGFKYRWESIRKDGLSVGADTLSANMCTTLENEIDGLKPNRKYNFRIVLDVHNDVDSVVWNGVSDSGWEWKVA
jgi:hypothetical protein